MSPVQIVRTVAIALIAGGVALGLVPGGTCGAGWWEPNAEGHQGWFAMGGEMPSTVIVTCEAAMAPVGSWAIALVVIGAALLAGAWLTTSNRPKAEPTR